MGSSCSSCTGGEELDKEEEKLVIKNTSIVSIKESINPPVKHNGKVVEEI